jgi:hypothetical protein
LPQDQDGIEELLINHCETKPLTSLLKGLFDFAWVVLRHGDSIKNISWRQIFPGLARLWPDGLVFAAPGQPGATKKVDVAKRVALFWGWAHQPGTIFHTKHSEMHTYLRENLTK